MMAEESKLNTVSQEQASDLLAESEIVQTVDVGMATVHEVRRNDGGDGLNGHIVISTTEQAVVIPRTKN